MALATNNEFFHKLRDNLGPDFMKVGKCKPSIASHLRSLFLSFKSNSPKKFKWQLTSKSIRNTQESTSYIYLKPKMGKIQSTR